MTSKKKTDWNGVLNEVPKIVKQYSTKLTLRQLYYRLVAALLLPNILSSYKTLSAKLVKAREDRVLPWDVIEDRTRNADVRSAWNHTAEITADELQDELVETISRIQRDYFSYDYWHKQPYYVEVWYEKEALEALFQQVCQREKVTSFACKGYPSATKLKEAADRFEEYHIDRECVIVYFGDFDPSGKDIPRYIEDKLVNEHHIEVEVKIVALHLEQIQKYGFPTMPVKKADARSEQFIEKYGSGVVELDAVPPDQLQGWITTAILDYFDDAIRRKWKAIADRRTHGYRERAKRALQEVLDDSDALIAAIEAELEAA